MILAVNKLHENGIYHNNIKPKNILVRKIKEDEIDFQLTDFGLINLLLQKENCSERLCNPEYLAPEHFFDVKDNSKIDYWQIGILAYYLLVGKTPFEGNHLDIALQIKYKEIELPSELIQSVKARDFISKILIKDVNKRLGKEAVDHPWIKQEDKIQEMEVSDDIKAEALKNMWNYSKGSILRNAFVSLIMDSQVYNDNQNQYITMFKKLDKDNNGFVTKEEFLDEYGSFFPNSTRETRKKINDMVDKCDANKDNKVDLNEFLFITNTMHNNISDKYIEEMFIMIDKDNTGFIEKNDIRHAFISQDFDIEGLLEEFDTDNDNKLTLEEFKKLIKEGVK